MRTNNERSFKGIATEPPGWTPPELVLYVGRGISIHIIPKELPSFPTFITLLKAEVLGSPDIGKMGHFFTQEPTVSYPLNGFFTAHWVKTKTSLMAPSDSRLTPANPRPPFFADFSFHITSEKSVK